MDLTHMQTWLITPQQNFVLWVNDSKTLHHWEMLNISEQMKPLLPKYSEQKLAGLLQFQIITSCDWSSYNKL